VTSTLDGLDWNLKQPSQKWLDSLKTVYTADDKKDYFNVDSSGTCKELLAPEPSAIVLAVELVAPLFVGSHRSDRDRWGRRQ
jgi:hypothetical protein